MVALTVLLIALYFMLQNSVAVAVLLPAALSELVRGAVAPEQLSSFLATRTLDQLGLLAWLGVAIGTPAALVVTWALARWRFGTARMGRRLGLVAPRLRHALLWLLALVVFGLLWERVVVWLDRPPMPDVMHRLFTTAGWLPGLVVAVVILAPAAEELIFRGFCLGGLAPFGGLAAITVSSLLFAAIHLQYDAVDMLGVLLLGALFGAARWHTGSTVLAFGLHAIHNAMATLQAIWLVGEAGG